MTLPGQRPVPPRINGAPEPPVVFMVAPDRIEAKLDRIQRTLYVFAGLLIVAWCLLTVVLPVLVDILPVLSVYGQP